MRQTIPSPNTHLAVATGLPPRLAADDCRPSAAADPPLPLFPSLSFSIKVFVLCFVSQEVYMVRSKAPAKKQQKHGVDFKKIKRKIGRKLPPPKNATNTEIKSKAIILPEQSVAAEKEGLAVSKKGLTLKELLQQTSHHNAKVRKDALVGIRDLALNYPAELKSHKLSIIEKLRERISDDDKVVRETLYQLLKLVILPHSKEDIPGPFISLIMAYIFNAMTHPAIDVRLMAFKFFDLVVQHYPSSFSMYVEKVLQNYEDILRNNQIYLQEKGKLKSALAGLVRCLSLLPCSEGEVDLLYKKTNAGRDLLHSYEDDMPKKHSGLSSVIKKTKDLMPVLVNCFLELTPSVHVMPPVDAQTFDCMFTVLQSIDLAVKSFADEIPVYKRGSAISDLPICERPDMTVWEDNMMSKILKKFFDVFPLSPVHDFSEKDDDKYFILNIRIAKIFLTVREWIFTSAVMMEKFLQFIENVLSEKVFNRTRASNTLRDKHLVSLFPFIPKLVSQVPCNWKSCLLQAFTKAFKDCRPESSLKLACLSAIKEMLLPSQRCSSLYLDASDPEILGHQVTWIQELPSLLIQLGDKHPSSSKVVLDLQLCLGQYALLNSDLAWEFDNMQYKLGEFYSTCLDGKDVCYGPFVKLPKDCQELSICCLYYFSSLDSLLIKSVAQCCLCENLEPYMLLRIIEVLQSAYKSGHIQIADHISFFVTLLACFQVFPRDFLSAEKSCAVNDEKILNHATFKSIIRAVSSFLLQMGDRAIVLQISQRIILDQISVNPPIDNMCALLRMLVMLDFIPTRLSEQIIINLSYSLLGYLLKASSYIPGQAYKSTDTDTNQNRICQYYFVPCFYLFERSNKLLNLVLDLMASLVIDNKSSCSHHWSEFAFGQPSRINAVVSVLTYMLKEEKIQQILSSSKAEIKCILQNIFIIQSSKEINITMEERHKIHFAFDQLKAAMDRLPC